MSHVSLAHNISVEEKCRAGCDFVHLELIRLVELLLLDLM